MAQFGGMEPLTVSFDLTQDPAGNEDYALWRAPVAMTINRFSAVSNKTQNAGTAITVKLVNFGTAGTGLKASGGTICGVLGGTAAAARLTADTPATLATFTNPYIAAGEWVALQLLEEGSGWETGERLRVQFDAVYGNQAANA